MSKSINGFVLIMFMCIFNSVLLAQKIAILKSPLQTEFKDDAGFADPEVLAESLRKDGLTVVMVDEDALSDNNAFNSEKYDTLILPYGPYFPLSAVDNFKKFLKDGGNFFSMGGYAFDRLYDEKGQSLPPYSRNLLRNPDFAEGLKYWNVGKVEGARAFVDKKEVCSGDGALCMELKNPEKEWFTITQSLPVRPGRILLSSQIKTDTIEGGVGAFVCIQFLDSTGKRLEISKGRTWQTPGFVKSGSDWQQAFRVSVRVPRGASQVQVALNLNGQGRCWFDDIQLKYDNREMLNTHYGKAETLNTLVVGNDQISIFDVSLPFENVTSIKAADNQYILPQGLEVAVKSPRGLAASSMIGNNDPVHGKALRKRISLLQTYDKFGLPRGSALSLVFNFDGYYPRSAWGFSGISSVNIFGKGTPLLAILPDILKRMSCKIFLASAMPKYYSRRQGQTQVVVLNAVNFTAKAFAGKIKLGLIDKDSGKKVYESQVQIKMPEDSTQEIELPIKFSDYDGDVYRIVCELEENDGKAFDEIATGFVVWHEDRIKEYGYKLKYQNNYFGDNDRPEFLCGSNQTGMMFVSDCYTPDVWDEDFKRMSQNGLKILRLLHTSPMASQEYKEWGDKVDISNPSEEYFQKMDAMVYLAQKYGIILMVDTRNTNGRCPILVDNEFLDSGVRFIKKLAERYADIKGIIFDYCNEPHVGFNLQFPKDIVEDYNDFLQKKYGSNAMVSKAWDEKLPARGTIPFVNSRKRCGWTDMRSVDQDRFLIKVFERFIDPKTDCLRKNDLKRCVTLGFSHTEQMNIFRQASNELTVFNYHAYRNSLKGDVYLKAVDMRYAGRSATLGEFSGIMSPSWSKDGHPMARYDAKSYARMFHEVTHTCFGMGYSFVSNWSFRDLEESYFLFGVYFSQDFVGKFALDTYGNSALLLSSLKPQYVEPQVGLLLPSENMLGNSNNIILDMVYNSMRALFHNNVRFVVIDEKDFKPENPRLDTVFMPVPFTMSDETFERLEKFVKLGGNLYISGDISYDTARKDTKRNRLKDLCGVSFRERRYPNIEFSTQPALNLTACQWPMKQVRPCVDFTLNGASVLAQAGDKPVAVLNELGKGRVLYTADMSEVDFSPELTAQYKWFLEKCERLPTDIVSHADDLIVYSQFGLGGEKYYVFWNKDNSGKPQAAQIECGERKYEITIAGRTCGLLAVNKEGLPFIAECAGKISLDGETLLDSSCVIAVMDPSRKDIRYAKELKIFSFGAGKSMIKSFAMAGCDIAGIFTRDMNSRLGEIPIEHVADGVSAIMLDRDSCKGVISVVSK